MRVATEHSKRGVGTLLSVGVIARWLPAGDDPEEDPPLFYMAHADGDGEDLEAFEVEEAIALYAASEPEALHEALERAASQHPSGKYENTACKRGQRAAAFGGFDLERLKNDLIDLEDSVRTGLRAAGSGWEKQGGARSERALAVAHQARQDGVADLADLAANSRA